MIANSFYYYLELHISSDDQNQYQEQIPKWSASTPGLLAKDTDCPSHPMRRFRWWIVLNIKTYLIIPHNRDAVANEIKSYALDHELDEFNTGNAKADRSCLGLYLCYSIQAMSWKSAALLEYTLQKSQEIQTPSYTTLSDYTVERFQETRVLSYSDHFIQYRKLQSIEINSQHMLLNMFRSGIKVSQSTLLIFSKSRYRTFRLSKCTVNIYCWICLT